MNKHCTFFYKHLDQSRRPPDQISYIIASHCIQSHHPIIDLVVILKQGNFFNLHVLKPLLVHYTSLKRYLPDCLHFLIQDTSDNPHTSRENTSTEKMERFFAICVLTLFLTLKVRPFHQFEIVLSCSTLMLLANFHYKTFCHRGAKR
jgi:hypothetical protein